VDKFLADVTRQRARKSAHQAFDLRFAGVAEIDEQSEAEPSRCEIVQHLGAVFGNEFSDSLQLDNDPVVANEIRHITVAERSAFVGQGQRFRDDEWNSTFREFE